MSALFRRIKKTRAATAAGAALAVLAAGVFVGVGIADAAVIQSAGQTPSAMMFKSDTVQRSFAPAQDVWVDVPGTDTSFQSIDSSFMYARFGGQSRCEGTTGWCSVRILLANEISGGFVEGLPADGTNFVWQMAGAPWGQTMIDRHLTVVLLPASPPRFRNFNAKVQVALHGGATRFRIQDWTLSLNVVSSRN